MSLTTLENYQRIIDYNIDVKNCGKCMVYNYRGIKTIKVIDIMRLYIDISKL